MKYLVNKGVVSIMKTYAIVSILNENIYTILNKNGVKSKACIFTINRFTELYELLEVNDKVIVVTIGDFINCSNLCWILNALNSKNIQFTSLSERIKFSSKYPLKRTYHDYISKVVNHEQRLLSDLQKNYPLQNRTDMNRRIQALCLNILIETFRNDSILSR